MANKFCDKCIYKDGSYTECDVCSDNNNFMPNDFEVEIVARKEN